MLMVSKMLKLLVDFTNLVLRLSISIASVSMVKIQLDLTVMTTPDQHIENVKLGNMKRFQFRELQAATENFSSKNILGKGGFGIVYRGQLPDGTLVAVKRLKDGNAAGGEAQFQTEVEMISLAVHRNLLRLYGFCMTASERLLVYPYMSNGSVALRLKGKISRFKL